MHVEEIAKVKHQKCEHCKTDSNKNRAPGIKMNAGCIFGNVNGKIAQEYMVLS